MLNIKYSYYSNADIVNIQYSRKNWHVFSVALYSVASFSIQYVIISMYSAMKSVLLSQIFNQYIIHVWSNILVLIYYVCVCLQIAIVKYLFFWLMKVKEKKYVAYYWRVLLLSVTSNIINIEAYDDTWWYSMIHWYSKSTFHSTILFDTVCCQVFNTDVFSIWQKKNKKMTLKGIVSILMRFIRWLF